MNCQPTQSDCQETSGQIARNSAEPELSFAAKRHALHAGGSEDWHLGYLLGVGDMIQSLHRHAGSLNDPKSIQAVTPIVGTLMAGFQELLRGDTLVDMKEIIRL